MVVDSSLLLKRMKWRQKLVPTFIHSCEYASLRPRVRLSPALRPRIPPSLRSPPRGRGSASSARSNPSPRAPRLPLPPSQSPPHLSHSPLPLPPILHPRRLPAAAPCARPRHRLPILDPISPLPPSCRHGHTGPHGQIHHCRLSPSGGDTTRHPVPPSPPVVHIGHGDGRRPPCNPPASFPGQAPPVRHSQASLHCHTAPTTVPVFSTGRDR
jgi:hypothetical protein